MDYRFSWDVFTVMGLLFDDGIVGKKREGRLSNHDGGIRLTSSLMGI